MATAVRADETTGDFAFDPSQPVTLGEVLRRIPNQWVVMAVTRYSELDEPLEGMVVSHGHDSKQVVDRVPNILNDLPVGALGIFYFAANRMHVPSRLTDR